MIQIVHSYRGEPFIRLHVERDNRANQVIFVSQHVPSDGIWNLCDPCTARRKAEYIVHHFINAVVMAVSLY